MRRFVDWASTREWVVVEEDYPKDEIYIETGCPKYALTQLVQSGSRVFMCSGRVVSNLRKELGWKKSDENDAKLIQELYHRDPSIFYRVH